MKKSCKDCTDRYIGCHSKCETYIQFKKEKEEINKKKEKERKINEDFYSVRNAAVKRKKR